MLLTAIVILTFAVVAMLLHSRRHIPHIALFVSVLLAVLIPNFGPSDEYQILLIGGSAAIGLLAIIRTRPDAPEGFVKVNGWIIAYLAYSAGVAIFYLPTVAGAFRAVSTLGLIAVVLLARRATATPSNYFTHIITAVVLLEVVFGLAEAFFSQPAVWPRPDGSDRLASRVNHLAPWLDGRVLGSLAGPIPYGTIAGFGLIVAAWMIIEYKRKGYLLLFGASAVGLLLSGTRSAIIAVIVVVAIWLISRSSASRPVTIVFGALGAGLFVLLSDVSQLFGLQGVEDTNSFEHRNEIIGSISQILTLQSPFAVVFGNGDNARDLLTDGIITTTTGVTVYDNQLVRELAASGVLGVVLLAAGIIAALRRGNGLSRMIVVFSVMMFFSFDALTWRAVIVVFLIACAGPLAPKLKAATAEPEALPDKSASTKKGYKS